MIVRISSEGQYELTDDCVQRVNELDNAAVAAADANDEATFLKLFADMVELVRREGGRLADDDLRASDVILPPSDSTLAEARADFTGDGLIPD
jgi:hypothetical protein